MSTKRFIVVYVTNPEINLGEKIKDFWIESEDRSIELYRVPETNICIVLDSRFDKVYWRTIGELYITTCNEAEIIFESLKKAKTKEIEFF